MAGYHRVIASEQQITLQLHTGVSFYPGLLLISVNSCVGSHVGVMGGEEKVVTRFALSPIQRERPLIEIYSWTGAAVGVCG